MALTLSTMMPLGTTAPDFTLLDVVSDKKISLSSAKSDIATVIMFVCNHCPYVQHIQKKLVDVTNEYKSKQIQFIAICSNDSKNYPDDSPKKMKEVASKMSYPFYYLHDETQEVAQAYQAACTPDFFIFDHNLQCVYRGQFDDSRPSNNFPVTGKDLCDALNAILSHHSVNLNQKPSMGCNIKWK